MMRHHLLMGPASLLGLVFPFGLVFLAVALSRARGFGPQHRGGPHDPPPSSGPAIDGGARRETGNGLHRAQPQLGTVPVRASDAEREETARLVSRALGEGRLNIEEAGQRLDAVLAARHRHELASLVADLPAPSAPDRLARRRLEMARRALLLAGGLVTVLALVVQLTLGIWGLWPVAVIIAGASARASR